MTIKLELSDAELAHIIAAVGYRWGSLLGKDGEQDYAATIKEVLDKLRVVRDNHDTIQIHRPEG